MSSDTFVSAALAPVAGTLSPATGVSRLPAIPWRDPHSVPPEQLAAVIASLKEACALNPTNVDVRVCLGIAYAMNYNAYESMDILEEARTLGPTNFMAQFKSGIPLTSVQYAMSPKRKPSAHWNLPQRPENWRKPAINSMTFAA